MLKIQIDTNNAAFDKNLATETARILTVFAGRIANGELIPERGNLRDINGNTVGEWHWPATLTTRD